MVAFYARFCVFLSASLVVLFLLRLVDAAFAAENGTHDPAEKEQPLFLNWLLSPQKSVYFSGFDAAGQARLLGWGSKHALGSTLHENGWRMLTSQSLRLRERNPMLKTRFNRMEGGQLLFGHEWFRNGFVISAMAGGSLVLNSVKAASASHRALRLGPIFSLDLWKSWEKNTVLLRATTLYLALDSANRSLYARMRHGFARPDWAFILGPEISTSIGLKQKRHGITFQDEWRIARAGLHVSEIPLFRLRLGVSGGIEWQHGEKPEPYMQIGSYLKY